MTKEQEEGHSIGAQRRRLADYCARKGLDVIPGPSSWSSPRPRASAGNSRRITQDEYDTKARELKERRAEIAARIEQHREGRSLRCVPNFERMNALIEFLTEECCQGCS